jgi:serine protease Do
MNGKNTLLLTVFALVALLIAGCSSSGAQQAAENTARSTPEPPQSIPDNEPVAQVAAQLRPSVVQINVNSTQQTPDGQQQRKGIGSGVIYTTDGYIITNNHVVQGSGQVNVLFANGSTETGEVVGGDRFTDVAVVKVDRNDLPAADFNSKTPVVGELAVAVGSPSGFESTVTSGVISGLNRQIPERLTGQQQPALVDLIQTDAAISPGNSGGALANRQGKVVGINVAYLPPGQTGAENIGFAIPASTATDTADQLIQNGEVNNPFLGIFPASLTPSAAQQLGSPVDSGVIVERVEQGTPAAEAGLQQGDIITAIDGEQVKDTGDLFAALRNYQPGDSVELTVVRDGNEQTVSLTLGEREPQTK